MSGAALRIVVFAACLCLAPAAGVGARQAAASGDPVDARVESSRRLTEQRQRPSASATRAAFERLKGLAGTWDARSTESATGDTIFDSVPFEYRVTGAGTVLMELANAGTAEEMLSVFHMEGDRLVLQHYCTAGNQPRLELVRAEPAELVFDLAGGTNFDPAVDGHIHRVRFAFTDTGVESWWTWNEGGRDDHAARRVLRKRR